MKLVSLQLDNFRRYKNETMEFPDGLIGIVGKNGAGKSTLMEAIGWCLYGNDAARTKKEEIKRTDAPESSECKVTVELILDSDTVKIERSMKGKNSTSHARVFLNGEESASVNGTYAVTNYISKRTGMDHVAFFTSVFAKQKELAALSNMGKAERKKVVLRLLGVEQINDVISLIRSDLRQNKQLLEVLQETTKDIDQLNEELREIEEKKQSKGQEITTIKLNVSKLEKSLKDAKEKFAKLEQKYKTHQQLENKISEISGEINSTQDEKEHIKDDLNDALNAKKEYTKLIPKLEKFTKIKLEKKEYDDLKIKYTQKTALLEQFNEYKSQIDEKNDEILRLDLLINENKGLDDQLKKISNELDNLQKEYEENRNQENRIQTKIDEKNDQKNSLEEELDEIKKLGGKTTCLRCKQPISKEYIPKISKHYTSLINEIHEKMKLSIKEKSTYTNKLEDITKKIQQKQEEENSIQEKSQELKNLKAKLVESKNTLTKTTTQQNRIDKQLERFATIKYDEKKHLAIITLYDELEEINEDAISLKTKSNVLNSLAKRLDSINNKISSMNEKISSYQEQLKDIGFDEKKYEQANLTKQEINEEFYKQREILIDVKYELTNIDENIERQKQEIKDEKSRQEIKKEAEEKIESLQHLESLMNEFKMDLISRIKPQLSSRTSELFRQMTGGKYSTIELDDDYTIWINDQGKSHPIERYSGGETDLANLCLRIAISQELSQRAGGSGTQFITLDEIFGSQDESRQESILQALKFLETQFRQILLITHIENIKESLPNVFHIKENADNSVTISEEGRMFEG